MKIKRLEIAGFKSFPDRVSLDFQRDVTAIVGPNGCGKSNIVDSIRWCMGEQSVKNLRGKAMEDVIFAGSENRKALGIAEVSLVFSTEDGRAPAQYLDFSEIQLTRRLYRDGESEYLMNKTPCRLMDITELFMDTGVGTRAYSIIEQGKIAMILHARPEERRFLIEEAAGVTKFKSRKQQALKKMEATRHNLSRLKDVIGEVRRQLSSLQSQANKAEKFRGYRDELRKIRLILAAHDYAEALALRQAAEKDQLLLNDRVRTEFAVLSLAEVGIEETRLRLVESEKQLITAQEETYIIRTEFETTGSEIEFQQRELANLIKRLNGFESEMSELEERMRECSEQRSLLEQRCESSNAEAEVLRETLRREEAALELQQQAEQKLSLSLETRNRELFAAISEATQYKSCFESAGKRLMQLEETRGRYAREQVQLAERLELVRNRALELAEKIISVERERKNFQSEVEILLRHEEDIKKQLLAQENGWQETRDKLTRSSSRLHSLRELESRFEGYNRGVKSLMQAPELRGCFIGLLADAICVPQELETALEAVLSDRLQCVLCSDEQTAIKAMEYLKSNHGGMATLALPAPLRSCEVPVIVGASPLGSLAQVDGPHEALIRALLSGVMLVDTLKTAIECARSNPECSFVTREGEVAAFGSMISGGSLEQAQSGIIHKKREIRELEALVCDLEQRMALFESERNRLRRDTGDVAERIKNASTTLHQNELKLVELGRDQQLAEDEIARILERMEVRSLEVSSLKEEQNSQQTERRLAQERMDEIGAVVLKHEQDVASYRVELDECRKSLGFLREQLTTVRVKAATLKEQSESSQNGLAGLELRSRELAERMVVIREEIENGIKERTRLQYSTESLSEKLKSLNLRREAAERCFSEIQSTFRATGEELAEAEKNAKIAREKNEIVRQEQSELGLRLSSVAMQLDALENALKTQHRISPTDALKALEDKMSALDDFKSRQTELQLLLDEMGEVNLMAIDEYSGAEARFEFLESQKNDLEESLRSLQNAIQRINRATRQRFLETYNLVNEKFKSIFPRLFCGGRAELRLTNEDDLLETGVDIIAQPPGKKLQNVTLLSGGEKALTAVALIFSIFLVKPTPFCLLDEVDAPLDDANIGRFNEMVREMSKISQFIIITHNKTTMQVADTLYGITMESPGASKVVSVKLR